MVRTLTAAPPATMLAASTRAGEEPAAPRGLPPRIALARVDEKGQLTLKETVTEYAPQQRAGTVVQDGKTITTVSTVLVPVTTVRLRSADLKDVQAYGADGKQIDAKKLPQLLRKETPVLMSADGQRVDPR